MGSVVYQRGHGDFLRQRVRRRVCSESCSLRPLLPSSRLFLTWLPTKVDLYVRWITKRCQMQYPKRQEYLTLLDIRRNYQNSKRETRNTEPALILIHSAATHLPELRVSREFCDMFP
jgi:hypothetical protein